MQESSSDAHAALTAIAQRHGVSPDAVQTLLRALGAGHGTMAQFDHPDLGGLGQWNQGGMTMVGRMFDRDLRTRVDALCTELAGLLRDHPELGLAPTTEAREPPAGADFASETWWPAELGQPSTAGSQNTMRYAIFPASRRLAIETGGRVTLYDTGDHLLSGVSQQQGVDQSLAFTSQHGRVPLPGLPVVEPEERSSPHLREEAQVPREEAQVPREEAQVPREEAQVPREEAKVPREEAQPGAAAGEDEAARPHAPGPSPERPPTDQVAVDNTPVDHLATLAGLADLHARGVLTDPEFAAKKAEILARI